jgi:hypothetical protein
LDISGFWTDILSHSDTTVIGTYKSGASSQVHTAKRQHVEAFKKHRFLNLFSFFFFSFLF